jgi:choline dehydrogenase-like flavoprotein
VRILLASDSALAYGLGNDRDLVGRYYMTHLTGECGCLVARDRNVAREFDILLTHDGVYCQRILCFTPQIRANNGMMNIVFRPWLGDVSDPDHASATLSVYYLARKFMIAEQQMQIAFAAKRDQSKDPGSFRTACSHAINIARRVPEALAFSLWWAYRKRLALRRMPILFANRQDGRYPLQFSSEQAPNSDSRIVLTNSRDGLGMRRLSVRWRTSDEDRGTVWKGYTLIRRALSQSVSATVAFQDSELQLAAANVAPSGGHHMGGARMGKSPAESVVDTDLQVWGTKGLYVASSAVFPTSGAASPTLTIVALSLRLAERLRCVLSSGPSRFDRGLGETPQSSTLQNSQC